MKRFIIFCVLLFGILVAFGYYFPYQRYTYCTKYKIVKDFTYSPYRNNPPFYVLFIDGTASFFNPREDNTPIIGKPLCINYQSKWTKI